MPDLADGEEAEIQGSAKKPYVIRNTGGVYSCSCPAWRNQSLPIEKRTCKHIRKLRGDAAEKERTGGALPTRAKSSKAKKDGPPILLAHTWENDVDLAGWWMSEKLDGVRAYWDGTKFLSRLGNEFHAPDWFKEGLPETPLDGELWMDRKSFQKTISIVRRQDKSDHWQSIRYVLFDAPALDDPFERRFDYLTEVVADIGSDYVERLDQQRCKDLEHLREELARVESLGGEGLMLRQPESKYEVGRSISLLKVKTFHDAEAVVIDHVKGKGRHKGRLGAVVAQLPDGTEFSVGTGFSDKERENPPDIGSTITFRYQELSDGGVPRFPSFVRLHGTPANPTPKQPKPKKKSPAKKSTQVKADGPLTGARYFEYLDGTSAKFWEVSVDGCNVTTRYGRIGSDGRSTTKTRKDEAAAEAFAEKLVDEKTGKGYEERSL